jgi:hypothetical protein
MPPGWKQVMVPDELHAALKATADAMLAAHQAGRLDLPGEFVAHVPLHHVVRTALDHMLAKQGRSRAPRRARAKVSDTGHPAGGDRS